jgi:DNA-binding phage protein
MAKTKTSCVQKKSVKTTPKLRLKKGVKIVDYSPTQELLDETLIRNAIWECLIKNDSAGVIKVLEAYFEAVSKQPLCQKHSLARSTLYHSFKEKNPTLRTLAKLVSAVHANAQ